MAYASVQTHTYIHKYSNEQLTYSMQMTWKKGYCSQTEELGQPAL